MSEKTIRGVVKAAAKKLGYRLAEESGEAT